MRQIGRTDARSDYGEFTPKEDAEFLSIRDDAGEQQRHHQKDNGSSDHTTGYYAGPFQSVCEMLADRPFGFRCRFQRTLRNELAAPGSLGNREAFLADKSDAAHNCRAVTQFQAHEALPIGAHLTNCIAHEDIVWGEWMLPRTGKDLLAVPVTG